MATKIATDAFLQVLKNRRTIYTLNKDLGAVSTARIQELVNETTLHTPSSFNGQSNRVVVLFGAEHDKLWSITSDILKAIVPADNWESTANRIAGFAGAAGSVLFFEDEDVVRGQQEAFAIYADRFPGWSTQSAGMQQLALWAALENEGLGANLQHYNPLIDDKVRAQWNLPISWKLNAQLVFGGRAGEAGPKDFKPLEERVKVFGA